MKTKSKRRAKQKVALPPHYSGRQSVEFWERVNLLPERFQAEAYTLGCALQVMENFVLKRLTELGIV